jgi:hypothetical protein
LLLLDLGAQNTTLDKLKIAAMDCNGQFELYRAIFDPGKSKQKIGNSHKKTFYSKSSKIQNLFANCCKI